MRLYITVRTKLTVPLGFSFSAQGFSRHQPRFGNFENIGAISKLCCRGVAYKMNTYPVHLNLAVQSQYISRCFFSLLCVCITFNTHVGLVKIILYVLDFLLSKC